jgi:hypothetical protein
MQGTVPAPGVEVRIRDSAGATSSTHTDLDGNFLIRGSQRTADGGSAPYAYPVFVGARNATSTRLMATALTTTMNGGCAAASCHTGSYGGGALFGGAGYWAVHVP